MSTFKIGKRFRFNNTSVPNAAYFFECTTGIFLLGLLYGNTVVIVGSSLGGGLEGEEDRENKCLQVGQLTITTLCHVSLRNLVRVRRLHCSIL